MVDGVCAEAVRRECEFFAADAKPRPGYEGGDIWNIKVQGIGGEPIATMSALIRDGEVTYFDLLFWNTPDDDPLAM